MKKKLTTKKKAGVRTIDSRLRATSFGSESRKQLLTKYDLEPDARYLGTKLVELLREKKIPLKKFQKHTGLFARSTAQSLGIGRTGRARQRAQLILTVEAFYGLERGSSISGNSALVLLLSLQASTGESHKAAELFELIVDTEHTDYEASSDAARNSNNINDPGEDGSNTIGPMDEQD